jgi:hypothetical protein
MSIAEEDRRVVEAVANARPYDPVPAAGLPIRELARMVLALDERVRALESHGEPS